VSRLRSALALPGKIAGFYGRFLPSFSRVGYACRSLRWAALDADFSGQTWLVTGASGGIGRALCLGAARRGARVLAVARDADKLAALLRGGGANIEALRADLALAREIEALVAGLSARGVRIDVLQNNVGVLLDDFTLTAEGREASLATNLLNHHLLTERLIDAGLLAPRAVVVNMSSGGMYNVPLRVSALRMMPATYDGVAAYALQKRAQVALNAWWRRREGTGGRAFYVMHPGWCDTAGVQKSLPRFRALLRGVLRDEQQGADTALWLAAQRPPQSDAEAIWFDRAPRPAHACRRTVRGDRVEILIAFLAEEAARIAPDVGG